MTIALSSKRDMLAGVDARADDARSASAASLAPHWADRAALAVLGLVAVIAALTFRDYGLGWDDYTHAQYGALLLKLFGSGYRDREAFDFVNLYYYGGGFDMAADLIAKVLPFDLFETRRLMGAAVGIVGLLATWRLARRVGGPVSGLSALVLLATCPLYCGHMFINAKDAPFATAMIVLLLGLVRALDEYPRPGPRAIVLAGVGLGLAFGSRILAGIAAPGGLVALVLIVVVERRELGLRSALARLWQFIVAMLPALGLAYLMMGLLWPWAIQKPLNPILASEYFSNFFEKPWREMFDGKLYAVPEMPLRYLPQLFALQLPEIMLGLGVIGFVAALWVSTRRNVAATRRAVLLTVALAVFVPIAVAIVLHPAFYNGLRHFVFVVPPFAVLGGLAAGSIAERTRHYGRSARAALTVIFLGGVALPVTDIVRLHPYEYSTFNWASGGVRMAYNTYMLDYWGLAFKQAGVELRAVLAARHETPPAGRRWVIEICGPQRPAEIALGPEFETTWDRQRADFAMMLGTYYCRDLRGLPKLVQISREGVNYARVFDIRGVVPVPKLITEPPP